MLFDVRGRRRHVIRVVYAILALLMGASLFLVVGPFNIANLIGNGTTTETAKVLVEQAERSEEKLRREPDNPALLLSIARTRVAAANAQTEIDPQTGAPLVDATALESFDKATEAWNRYLAQTESPSPSGAQLMASTFFTLAQTASGVEAIDESLANAARAQRIAAEAQPSVGTLTSLAIYEYFDGNFSAGNKAGKEAEAKAPPAQVKQIEEQLAEYRQRGKAWENEKQRVAKLEKEQGKESLENPFGGFGGSTGLGG